MHWKDLDVWKKSDELVKQLYKITSDFPKEELYGLVSQIKRAAISVPSNIVEGFSRNTTKEYIQFLYNSRGSLEEIRYLLHLSKELDYISKEKHNDLEKQYEEISKMLNALINSLKRKMKKTLIT